MSTLVITHDDIAGFTFHITQNERGSYRVQCGPMWWHHRTAAEAFNIYLTQIRQCLRNPDKYRKAAQ